MPRPANHPLWRILAVWGYVILLAGLRLGPDWLATFLGRGLPIGLAVAFFVWGDRIGNVTANARWRHIPLRGAVLAASGLIAFGSLFAAAQTWDAIASRTFGAAALWAAGAYLAALASTALIIWQRPWGPLAGSLLLALQSQRLNEVASGPSPTCAPETHTLESPP